MNSPTRVTDLTMLTLSVVLGVGSVFMFAMPQSFQYLPMRWPDSFVLPWDALLSLAFFAQHSGMVRRSARARLAAVIPSHYQGAAYAIASGIALALVVALWQPSETRLLVLEGAPRWTMQAVGALAILMFVLSAWTLGRLFDPLGLGPVRAHLRGQAYRPAEFVVRGPYLWVRHPLYSCILVMLWTNPDVTADRLLLSVMWTVWIGWRGAGGAGSGCGVW